MPEDKEESRTVIEGVLVMVLVFLTMLAVGIWFGA